MIPFEEFVAIIRNGEANGEIKTSVPLSDYDLAVQWAIGSIGERKAYPCDITADEIWQEMFQIFGTDEKLLYKVAKEMFVADTPQTERSE